MKETTGDYHISFFKPTTPQAKANRNMVIWLVSIWFVAIFGFQVLLLVMGKPVPESSYLVFQDTWEKVNTGSYEQADLQKFAFVSLSVLGKTAIRPDEREVLDHSLSWAVYQLTPDSLRQSLLDEIKAFEQSKESISDISDPVYISLKKALSARLSPVLGLSELDVRTTIIPLELSSASTGELQEEESAVIPSIMEKYLIHNQSVLTDFKIIGFPFHYFYTAIFLLIMFVGLCLIYCIRTDNIYAKLKITD